MIRDEVMKLVEQIKKASDILQRKEMAVTSIQYGAIVREIKRKPSRIRYGSIKKDYVMLDDVKITACEKG